MTTSPPRNSNGLVRIMLVSLISIVITGATSWFTFGGGISTVSADARYATRREFNMFQAQMNRMENRIDEIWKAVRD